MAPAFVCFLIPALVPAKKRDVVGPVVAYEQGVLLISTFLFLGFFAFCLGFFMVFLL